LEVFEMADKSVRYTPEFKRQIVDLVRSGRTPASLSKEFGPTGWSIALWVKRARRDDGTGDGGLTTAEREELSRGFSTGPKRRIVGHRPRSMADRRPVYGWRPRNLCLTEPNSH
jgi:hypothetical protein